MPHRRQPQSVDSCSFLWYINCSDRISSLTLLAVAILPSCNDRVVITVHACMDLLWFLLQSQLLLQEKHLQMILKNTSQSDCCGSKGIAIILTMHLHALLLFYLTLYWYANINTPHLYICAAAIGDIVIPHVVGSRIAQ